MSSGEMALRDPPATPSITMSGAEEAASVEIPRNMMLSSPLGLPDVLEIPRPATFP